MSKQSKLASWQQLRALKKETTVNVETPKLTPLEEIVSELPVEPNVPVFQESEPVEPVKKIKKVKTEV